MLSIKRVVAETQHHYVLVSVLLENLGVTVVRPGIMFGRQISKEGAPRVVEFRNTTNILPGCTAKVSRLLAAVSELEFTAYRQSDGVTIPFSGGVVKRHSFFGSVAVVIRRWWNEVLLPQSKSLAAHFELLYGHARSRLAEVYKREKLQAQTARSALGSLNAKFMRWRNEVLRPQTESISARFKALHDNGWLRLAEAKQRRKHRADVGRHAWQSVDADILRWWNEVLLPRSKSLAAQFELLYGHARSRLAEVYKREKLQAQTARSALGSLNAKFMRWRNEVLRPQTESISARFKALHDNGWLRLAEAKQRRKHRADVERHAWQSVDADILRWWNEVLLPRSRSIGMQMRAMLGRHKGSE